MTLRSLAMLDVGARNRRQGVVFHLAHKMVDRGERVLVIDLGAEAALTESFLGEARLYQLWFESPECSAWWLPEKMATPIEVREGLFLLPGDPQLALGEAARQGIAAWRAKISDVLADLESDWLIVAIDPSLPVCFPLSCLASALVVIAKATPTALRTLPFSGQLYRQAQADISNLGLPRTQTLGYLVPQPLNRVFGSNAIYAACQARMPAIFRSSFELPEVQTPFEPKQDPWCLGYIDRPAGLYELAAETGKPTFHLRPADGASETLMQAVFDADRLYSALLEKLCQRYGALG